MKVWENSKKLWKHWPAARVPTAVLVLPNFHSCFYLTIGLITVSDAILTGRQSGQKLQCLYGNPMANNFFQNRILHKL